MKTLVFQIYDAFGDWISTNGMIRYLSEIYDEVYLVHDTPVVVPFTQMMFRDEPKIIPMEGIIEYGSECDVVDVRVNEDYPSPGNAGIYYCRNNKFYNEEFLVNDNASSFYSNLGFSPDIRIKNFNYKRDHVEEENLFSSLELPDEYSVVCEMEDNTIDRQYVQTQNIVNLHRLTDNFLNVLKVIENANDIHLIENSISLFVYHMQNIRAMKNVDINLHAYARKEPHRRCDGPECNNKFLNMLKYPELDNWNFIWK